MKRTRVFLITGFLGIFLVGLSLSLMFVKRTFGSSIFALPKSDCIPYNIFIEKGEQEYTAIIKWSTKKECVGFVQYGNQRDNLNLVAVDQINKVRSRTHEVKIEKLLTSQKYYFLINSDEVAYGYNGKALDFSLGSL
jgi:hypothetical protein